MRPPQVNDHKFKIRSFSLPVLFFNQLCQYGHRQPDIFNLGCGFTKNSEVREGKKDLRVNATVIIMTNYESSQVRRKQKIKGTMKMWLRLVSP